MHGYLVVKVNLLMRREKKGKFWMTGQGQSGERYNKVKRFQKDEMKQKEGNMWMAIIMNVNKANNK